MNHLPPYSVIIPAYNATAHLAEAVASVRRQPHAPAEIIVIDDGSTDDTAALAASLGPDIRCLRQENQGPAAARNHGIAAARHDHLAFIDADDLWPADKIAKQLGLLVEHPDLQMVLGLQQFFRLAPDPEQPDGPPIPRFEQPSFIYLVGCGVYRSSVFKRIGGFDETMRYGEDTDWFFRSWEQDTPMRIILEPMVHYRQHAGGMTHGRDAVQKGYLRVLKKSMDRRRQNGALRPFPLLFKELSREQLEATLAFNVHAPSAR